MASYGVIPFSVSTEEALSTFGQWKSNLWYVLLTPHHSQPGTSHVSDSLHLAGLRRRTLTRPPRTRWWRRCGCPITQ